MVVKDEVVAKPKEEQKFTMGWIFLRFDSLVEVAGSKQQNIYKLSKTIAF
jgi:hypothetical protein